MPVEKPNYIALMTDFGQGSPYLGQLHALLADSVPDTPVIDLIHDAPRFNPRASAYLLAAILKDLPAGGLMVAVVDPGVGSDRLPLLITTDDFIFVGPDNGLFSQVIKSGVTKIQSIQYKQKDLSATFHGRDLFVPTAINITRQCDIKGRVLTPSQLVGSDWSDELAEVIYVDAFGNLFTGLQGESIDASRLLTISGRNIRYSRTFSDVPIGEAFWYVNSMGLIEIAVNQGNASRILGLSIGSPVRWSDQ